MKRGAHTDYVYEQALVYEFKGKYLVMQRGQQGVSLNSLHGRAERPAESVKLYAVLPVTCSELDMGSAVAGALDAFDTQAPDFEPWENKKLAALLKSSLGARGQKDI